MHHFLYSRLDTFKKHPNLMLQIKCIIFISALVLYQYNTKKFVYFFSLEI